MADIVYVNNITPEKKSKILENSVMAQPNNVTSNPTELKKAFVKPIVNEDGSPSIADEIDRVAEEANYGINRVRGYSANNERRIIDLESTAQTQASNIAKVDNNVQTLEKATTANTERIISVEGVVQSQLCNAIEFLLDENTYVLTFKALSIDGNVLSTSAVDFPLESVVVNGYYDAEKGEVALVLKNDQEIRFPITAVINGFVPLQEFNKFLETKGQPNGFASLDENGKVPKEQLPAGSGTGGISAEEFEELLVESLTNPAEEWTDEEKAAACETIGAVKTIEYSNAAGASGTDGTYHGRVYAVKYDGTEETVPIANQASNYSICWRDAAANIYVGDPTQQLHCVNKRYAEANFVAKPTDTIGFNRVYGILNNSTDTTYYNVMFPSYFSSESDAKRRNGIAYYDGGRLGCAPPEGDYEATNKKYVDDLMAEITDVDLSEIYDILNVAGLTATVEMESTYDDRPTAEGIPGALLPDAPTIVKSVKGNSVTTTNLLDHTKLQGGMYYDIIAGSYPVGKSLRIKATKDYESMMSNLGKFSDLIPTAKIGDTLYLYAHGTALSGSGFFLASSTTAWAFNGESPITVTKDILNGTISVSLVLNTAKDTYIEDLIVSKTPTKKWSQYFKGFKHSQFNGIVSTGKNLWNPEVNTWSVSNDKLTSSLIEIVGDEDLYLSVNGTPFTDYLANIKKYAWIKFHKPDGGSLSAGSFPADGKINMSTYFCQYQAKYFSVEVGLQSGAVVPDLSKTQLERVGVSAYEPYIESSVNTNNIYYRPGLGTEIDFVNKKEINRAVDVVLTGEESWYYYEYGKYQSVSGYDWDMPIGNKAVADYVSTDSEKTGDGYGSGNMWCGYNGTTGFFWLGILAKLGYLEAGTTPTIEEKNEAMTKFKAWLAKRYADGNPVKIRYVSAQQYDYELDRYESALEKLNFVTDEYGNNLGVMYMPYKDGVEYQSGNENKVYGANNTVIQEYEIVRKVGGDN